MNSSQPTWIADVSLTEIVEYPTDASLYISPETRRTWVKSREIVARHPGLQKQWWGSEADDPNMGSVIANWESRETHRSFQESAEFPRFIEIMLPFLRQYRMHHVAFRQSPQFFDAPLVQVARYRLPKAATDAECEVIKGALAMLAEAIQKEAGCLGAGWGPTIVTGDFEFIEQEKGAVEWIVSSGWDRLDIRFEFQEFSERILKDHLQKPMQFRVSNLRLTGTAHSTASETPSR